MKKKKSNKKWWIIGIIIVLVVVILIVILKLVNSPATNQGSGEQIEIVPLSQEQINILGQNILSSEFIADLPKNGVIGLQFYDFVDGVRIWQSGFLIGQEGFLSSGTQDMTLVMHTKYIFDLNENDLCDVVQSSKANGDMWVESEISDAKLFLKYASMMKYRDCFGF
ncbi:hypothetical protein KAI04_03705 [Candidatus Pacearchaeota archaeon]|nr:hypothetical protein [Candidatus Pacearchaeota archaeon]